MSKDDKKLGMFALMGLVVGSSIGGGIFNATRDVAQSAAAGPALLAWLVVGIGFWLLVVCMNNILAEKPELGGIVEYAEAGFGKFWGFMSGWGYWLSAWLGNVAYAALLLSALGNLVPAFSLTSNPTGPLGIDPHNIMPTMFISVVLWALVYLITRGVEGAAFINSLILVGKLVPLAVALVVFIVFFKVGVFTMGFWNNVAENLEGGGADASVFKQISGCFMVMIWVFVGVEGASIFSTRAKTKDIAAKATTAGFFTLLGIYVLLSLLPYGVMSRAHLAELGEPALAFVLGSVIGPVGSALVNIGLIISLIGAFLSWTLLPTEALQQMARCNYLPKTFNTVNKFGAPVFSLVLTTVCTQIFMLTFIFPAFKVSGMTPYQFGFTLCSSAILITWLLGALYRLKLGVVGAHKNVLYVLIGGGASLFQIWMIFQAGLTYILVSFITYIPGFFMYYKARKRDGEAKPLGGLTGIWVALITAGGIASIILLAVGVLSL
ncbi:MAG: basic amino acid/polyamine antiporter [Treponema sp.]|jgi:arginine:ornithine antiporter/lysine permease|nr:basic amino acid/polyamine antiporter [Treponema sp.]